MIIPANFLEIISLHKDCTEILLQKASKLDASDIELGSSTDELKLRRMVSDVMSEIFLMRGFVRLTQLGKIGLFGYMKPRHDVGRIVAARLARRFPGTMIILGNNERSWLALHDGKNTHHSFGGPLKSTVDEISGLSESGKSQDAGKLWETYYYSQYCEERKNKKYFDSSMPKKYLRAAGLFMEGKERNRKLDEF
jgi:probable DNA metabolism protein